MRSALLYSFATRQVAPCMLKRQKCVSMWGYSWPTGLAQIQDGLVDHRVGPVVPQIIQVIVKVNQALVRPSLQQRRCDLLRFAPVLKTVTGRQQKNVVKKQYTILLVNKRTEAAWMPEAGCGWGCTYNTVSNEMPQNKKELTKLLLCFSTCFHDGHRCAQWAQNSSFLIYCCPPEKKKQKPQGI